MSIEEDILWGLDRPNEDPETTAWYALTGAQRRLVNAFMADLERGVDLMPQIGLKPVTDPGAGYLMNTYGASLHDASVVSDWFARWRRKDTVEDRVRGILDAYKDGGQS